MKLEDHVCSLELSKWLKKLGVKQDSEYYWVQACQSHGMIPLTLVHREENKAWRESWNQEFVYAAFTVAELGEMSPAMVGDKRGKRCVLVIGKPFEKWQVSYRSDNHAWFKEEADTEADARAKMLIHLIEKGIVKP